MPMPKEKRKSCFVPLSLLYSFLFKFFVESNASGYGVEKDVSNVYTYEKHNNG